MTTAPAGTGRVPVHPDDEPGRPLLVFDGDCAFCTRCAALATRLPSPARVVPWQDVDLGAFGTTQERAVYELLWVRPDRRIAGGAQAVASFLVSCGRGWVVPGVLLRLPPLRWLAHALYRVVARNRHRLPGGSAACAVPRER